jgi:hypothetical protein
MRKRLHNPSPAMAVALIALFIALGGTTYAATGGNFILGMPNDATSQTGLTSNNGGKALNITQQSTGTGATALGLNLPAGKSPFTVNSGTKVMNLNADRLDGLDSLALQKRVSATCSGASAIKAIAATGSVNCEATAPNLVFSGLGGYVAVPSSASFITNGGPIAIQATCSGYRAAADGPGFVLVDVRIDGSTLFDTRVYTNETLSHKATLPKLLLTPLAAGTHTLNVVPFPDTKTDGNDACAVSILEYPS